MLNTGWKERMEELRRGRYKVRTNVATRMIKGWKRRRVKWLKGNLVKGKQKEGGKGKKKDERKHESNKQLVRYVMISFFLFLRVALRAALLSWGAWRTIPGRQWHMQILFIVVNRGKNLKYRTFFTFWYGFSLFIRLYIHIHKWIKNQGGNIFLV